MKVFFLPRWFPVPDDPLWGLFVLKHAQAVSRFSEVFVVYVDKTDAPDLCKGPLLTNVGGIPVLYHYYRASHVPVIGRMIMFFKMLHAWHRAWRFAVKQWGKPDINHVHILTRMGVFALIVKKLYGIPYVVTEHWSRYLPRNLYYRGWMRKMATRVVARNAGAIMPVTQNLAEAMQRFGLHPRRWRVIPNAVDTDLFPPGIPHPKSPPLTFVHVSTFDDRAKNISGILRVVASLGEKRSDFVLRLIGDGVDFHRMKELSARLGLPESIVRFEGAVPPERIPGILSSASLLLLFSNYENMPVVINEALAAGLPVVATRVGGIGEVITPEKGFLVEPGDEPALHRLLESILDRGVTGIDPAALKEYAARNFSMHSVGRQINNVYIEAIL